VRVLLDTTYAQRAPYSGTAVYLERLTDALATLAEVELVPTYNPRRRPPAGGGVPSIRNVLADSFWTEVELPRLARACRADIVHHPLPARVHARAIRQAITVHDLAFERAPERFAHGYRRYAQLTHRAAARAADAVICVSEATAAEVAARWGVAAERIVVAHHGPGQQLALLPRTEPVHFLYVGDDEPRKNLAGLLVAYGRYANAAAKPLALVLAGSATADRPGVRVERHPSPARLAELYAGAAALVHPALDEGFGLTPLEAMRAGTPVIATASSAVVEVCGDAVRYADSRDPEALAGALVAVAASSALRRELGEHGRRRAAGFSWNRSARAHVDAYALAGAV
jgi:glycosyltransferase involved in cell wall biosynthesis